MLGVHVLEPYGTRHGHGPNDWKFGDAFGSNTPAMYDESARLTCVYPCPPYAPASANTPGPDVAGLLGASMFGKPVSLVGFDDVTGDLSLPWWVWVGLGTAVGMFVEQKYSFFGHYKRGKKAG